MNYSQTSAFSISHDFPSSPAERTPAVFVSHSKCSLLSLQFLPLHRCELRSSNPHYRSTQHLKLLCPLSTLFILTFYLTCSHIFCFCSKIACVSLVFRERMNPPVKVFIPTHPFKVSFFQVTLSPEHLLLLSFTLSPPLLMLHTYLA